MRHACAQAGRHPHLQRPRRHARTAHLPPTAGNAGVVADWPRTGLFRRPSPAAILCSRRRMCGAVSSVGLWPVVCVPSVGQLGRLPTGVRAPHVDRCLQLGCGAQTPVGKRGSCERSVFGPHAMSGPAGAHLDRPVRMSAPRVPGGAWLTKARATSPCTSPHAPHKKLFVGKPRPPRRAAKGGENRWMGQPGSWMGGFHHQRGGLAPLAEDRACAAGRRANLAIRGTTIQYLYLKNSIKRFFP